IDQKYGGSSVADVAKLKQVADRVMRTRREGHDVVVVVSAMGDTTDELLGMAKQISAAPDRRELDMLLTAGERISMALLSMAIRELGGNAISFTGSQSGIITNDRHVDARIIEVRPYRVQDELARGKIVVGVASERDVLVVESDAGAESLLTALDEHHVAGKQLHVPTNTAHAALIVSRENLHDAEGLQRAMHARFGDRVTFISGLGAVSA